MKIIIERFGPIRTFEYDLDKNLIVTYGQNNIGKSYAMQIVYLLLKTFIVNMHLTPRLYRQMLTYPSHNTINMSKEKMEYLIKEFIDSDEQTKDITKEIITQVNDTISSSFMPEFMNSCRNTFGNLDRTLENNPVIILRYKDFDLTMDLKEKKIDGNINVKPIFLKKTNSDFHKSRNLATHLDIYVVDSVNKPLEIVIEEIGKLFINCVKNISGDFEDVYFLPASRSGIYAGMNAFGSIVAELSRNRAYFTKKIEFPGISEPISDYFISLSNIKSRENKSLEKFYVSIEDNILKGKVTFDKNKNALLYSPNNINASFEMTEVSSMVSEVSPIVAFLKYIVSMGGFKGKAILFIEEPEAHLHPNNQIALIEIFAKLIGENVKLIVSSHSNYVFNKLNNLVLAKELDYRDYDPIVLEETPDGSVSKHLHIDELGADDENFVDVSEDLYNERVEIIEKLNMEE